MPDPVSPITAPRPTVLYIEDQPEDRSLVRSVLEPKGIEVLEASDGLAGVDLAIRTHPDLILCDLQLRGIDGYETATRLRSYRGLDSCPIVVLAEDGDRGLSLAIGCDGYIEKPIAPDRFADQVREFLQGKRETLKGAEERRALREYSQTLVERLEATVRELSAANTRLRAAARSKTEFMQNLSHELATPLTPIAGYLKMLRSGRMGPLTEPQTRALEAMGVSAERLGRTIENLVDFASLDSGATGVRRDSFEPRALTRAVLEEERAKARSRRVHLEVLVETDEPGYGDERKLRQVLGNVVDNAIKFSPHGSEVLVRVLREGGRLLFEVYDQGGGLLPGEGEKVFEPFFHADRGDHHGEDRAPGAGLGLPVARQIVHAHGGEIWIESPPKTQPAGKHHFGGAKVSFWLPERVTAPPERPAGSSLFSGLPEGGTS